MLTPTMTKPSIARRIAPGRAAASTPSGTPATRARLIDRKVSSSVTGIAFESSSESGAWLT